ncbi:RHS repeat domain-containing protein, partial [Rhodopirellula sp. JC639]|uniref:RHS repeat domain-containing protein n=1 Tax=Stieleria mannarensis TaxID=2755585 RepID=UPI00336AC40E
MLCHRSSRRQNLRQRLARLRARGVKPCADLKSNRGCKTLRQPTCSPGKSRPENDRPSIEFTVRYLRTQQYSVTALTDPSGTIKERYAYDAYGNVSIFDGSGTARTSTAEGNRYTYTGREYDNVLNLYHYRARMYDPFAGRFCSRDPIFPFSGWSAYETLESNPVVFLDPSGLATWYHHWLPQNAYSLTMLQQRCPQLIARFGPTPQRFVDLFTTPFTPGWGPPSQ